MRGLRNFRMVVKKKKKKLLIIKKKKGCEIETYRFRDKSLLTLHYPSVNTEVKIFWKESEFDKLQFKFTRLI